MIALLPLLRRFGPYVLVVLLVLGGLFGAYRHGVRVTTDRYERARAEDRLVYEAVVRALQETAAARIAEIDAKHYQELLDAKTETDRTIAAIRAGERRLRERFTCPAAPPADAGAGVDPPSEARGLQPEDAAFLIGLAGEADAVVVQLSACQAILAEDRSDAAPAR